MIFVEVRRNTHELRNLIFELASEQDYEILVVGKKTLCKVAVMDIRTVVLQEAYGTRDILMVPTEKMSILNSYHT